jgi:transcriptional regulator with XRE-family HTH domain
MSTPHPFGAYLARAMDAARLSIADLERQTGINNSLISKWRLGRTVPSMENLRLLAPALRVPAMDLFVRAGHVRPDEAGMASVPEPPDPRPLTAEEAIRSEPYLSDDKKDVFIALLNTMRDEYAPGGSELESKEA